MDDTIQTLAERLAEALHGNTTTITTPHGLIILAPLPGSRPAPVAVEPPKVEAVTPSALRDLARQAAAKIGADQVRAILGKPIIEIRPSEAAAIAAKLKAVL
jgi:hypothetical protein